MKGQWIGNYKGSDTGKALINIDDIGEAFRGVAYLVSNNASIPALVAYFQTKDKLNEFEFEVKDIYPLNPKNSLIIERDKIKELFPDAIIPKKAVISGYYKKYEVFFNVKTDIETNIKIKVKIRYNTSKSRIKSEKLSWNDYKNKVNEFLNKNMIFRGQEKPFKLRTSFHRMGRYDFTKLILEDLPKIHQYISSATPHLFNLYEPVELGAFYNLIQHHGYPTPLLDWTYSPFIAAFFAFRSLPKKGKQNDKDFVRIFIFDQKDWKKHYNQIFTIERPMPHFSFIEFLPIENKRLIPQQAVTTITNVDDIEEYILEKEKESNSRYLYAIDIPTKERNIAMTELAYMGITAGAMFPGLDGICEELREKNFD